MDTNNIPSPNGRHLLDTLWRPNKSLYTNREEGKWERRENNILAKQSLMADLLSSAYYVVGFTTLLLRTVCGLYYHPSLWYLPTPTVRQTQYSLQKYSLLILLRFTPPSPLPPHPSWPITNSVSSISKSSLLHPLSPAQSPIHVFLLLSLLLLLYFETP